MSTEELKKNSEHEINDDTPINEVDVAQSDEVEELLDELEKRPREEQKEIITAIIKTESHRGPLPHPKILQGYEEACPGAADRIIQMAEKQQTHRMEMEKSVVEAGNRDSKLGLICGTGVCTLVIVSGVILGVLSDSAVAGSIISLSGLGSLVGTFIYGTRSNSKERKEKRDK